MGAQQFGQEQVRPAFPSEHTFALPEQALLPMHAQVASLHAAGSGTQWTTGNALLVEMVTHERPAALQGSHVLTWSHSDVAMHLPVQQLPSTSGTWPTGQSGVSFLQVTSAAPQLGFKVH